MSPRNFVAGLVVVGLIGALAYVFRPSSPPDGPKPERDAPVARGAADSQATKHSSDPQEPAASTGATGWSLAEKNKADARPAEPLFEGWSAPAAAIVLSGEMHGYVEPCGCSLNQL